MVGDPPDRGPPVTFEGGALEDYVYTQINGEANGSLWGGTIVGDLDRDGYDELLISDFGGSGPPESIDMGVRGATYLFYGRAQFAAQLSALDAELVIRGGGESAAPLGDVDGDGYDDCGFVSLCDCDALGTGADCACQQSSGLHILFGAADRASGEARADQVGTTFTGRAYMLRGAGDVNGDGFDDVLVGVSTQVNPSGIDTPEARLLLGGPQLRVGRSLDDADANLVGAGQDDASASGAGDVDGDGYDDILFGGSQTSLYYGGPNRFAGTLSRQDADATFDHQSSWYLLQPAGDLDGDGYADVALPSYQKVALFYGRQERFSGDVTLARRDASVMAYTAAMEGFGVGDIDQDGARDLLIGDPKEQTHGLQSGALFLLPGTSQRLAHDYVLEAGQVVMYGDETVEETSSFSYGTSSGGDLNGDGFDDILAGKPGNHIGDEGGGQVILILGGPLANE
jgi:hypothetical protein